MNTQTIKTINWTKTLKGLEVGKEFKKRSPKPTEVNSARNRISRLRKEGYKFDVSVKDQPFLKITCTAKP